MRVCGILKVALREDDPGQKLRLHADDVVGETVQGKPVEPGLYFCCREAVEKFAPRIVERLKKTPALDANGKPVLDADGQPVPILGPDATPATLSPAMLC